MFISCLVLIFRYHLGLLILLYYYSENRHGVIILCHGCIQTGNSTLHEAAAQGYSDIVSRLLIVGGACRTNVHLENKVKIPYTHTSYYLNM